MGQMGYKKERERKREEIVKEYVGGGRSYRELEEKYGVASSTIHRWVQEFEEASAPDGERRRTRRRALVVKQSELSTEVRELQRELEEARLYNKLLNTMIDIAEERMGIDIRKKRGAK